MPKLLRLLLSLFAVVSLSAAVAACGDDDDAEDATATTEADETDDGATDEGADEGEDGPPDENPCAEGGSGDLGEDGGPGPAADATPVTVTGTEYQFAGGEELATMGSYALTFTNVGTELHEAVVVKLADGETRPLEELLASEEEPETTDIAFAFACPGASSEPVAAEITEPGRYVMLCFIPVGTLPTTAPEDFAEGPPHAAQGMVREFQVA